MESLAYHLRDLINGDILKWIYLLVKVEGRGVYGVKFVHGEIKILPWLI